MICIGGGAAIPEKITSLFGQDVPGITFEPNPEVIARLEILLQQAKDGHLKSLSWAGEHANGAIGTGWTGGSTSTLMLGMVARLQLRIMNET